MPISIRMRATALAVVLLSTGACMDLDVTNVNEADRGRALAEAADVEALIAGTFRTWWNLQQGRAPGPAMASMADEQSMSRANYGSQDQGMEPGRAIINENAYQWGYWVYDPWLLTNRALASIRDGLQSIEDLNLQIGVNDRDGPRAQAFAKFMQGLLIGNLALQYDRAFLLDESVANPAEMELAEYPEVMAAARTKLAEARQLAEASPFSIPAGWMGTDGYSSADFVRLTHSYEARFMAAVARTPAERGEVDWGSVLSHVQNGVTRDFGVNLDGPQGNWWSGVFHKAAMGIGIDVDLALIGPADSDDDYIEYEKTDPALKEPFIVNTADRRIHGPNPTDPGLYVHYRPTLIQPSERGLWYQGNYAPWWYWDLAQTGFGFAPDLSLKEMGYLAAEAHIRLGQPAQALPYINGPRVENGQLPPATVDGVSGAGCVPRSAGLLAKAPNSAAEGACGNLMQTLIYEKQIETAYLYAGSSWYDHRGFGTLRTGRAYQCPIPAVDLELLGLSVYTFGGVGGDGAAP